MKKLSLEEWEKKYIVGPVMRFNQKDEMFEKPKWDIGLLEQLMKSGGFQSILGNTRDRPGFTLLDQALRWGAWGGAMLDLLNSSWPNPLQAAKDVETAVAASGFFHPFMAYHPQEGAKVDTSDPKKMSSFVKKAATFYGADFVGICKLDRRWLYSHTTGLSVMPKHPPGSHGDSNTEMLPEHPPKPVALITEESFKPQEVPREFQSVIVMAFEMDYDIMKYFHTYLNMTATYMGYSRLAFTSMLMSSFINNLGYKAINCSINAVSLHTPMALQAGLGELGRNGLLITPRVGPRVRLATVITDLPLEPDVPIEFGVTEFCKVCMKCADMCPSRSIIRGKRTTKNGELKWPINDEKCFLQWIRGGKDCDICMAVCPYNKVPSWQHRLTRWFTDHARWADRFYVKMDDMFGYGKVKEPKEFWEKWKPKTYGQYH